jgi:hypothetical protein
MVVVPSAGSSLLATLGAVRPTAARQIAVNADAGGAVRRSNCEVLLAKKVAMPLRCNRSCQRGKRTCPRIQ